MQLYCKKNYSHIGSHLNLCLTFYLQLTFWEKKTSKTDIVLQMYTLSLKFHLLLNEATAYSCDDFHILRKSLVEYCNRNFNCISFKSVCLLGSVMIEKDISNPCLKWNWLVSMHDIHLNLWQRKVFFPIEFFLNKYYPKDFVIILLCGQAFSILE